MDSTHPRWRQKVTELRKYMAPMQRRRYDALIAELEAKVAELDKAADIALQTNKEFCTRHDQIRDENDALKARVAELERDKALMDEADRLMITNGHPNVGYSVKYPGANEWQQERTLRAAIDSAVSTKEQPRYANLSCRCAVSFDCPEHPWKAAQEQKNG